MRTSFSASRRRSSGSSGVIDVRAQYGTNDAAIRSALTAANSTNSSLYFSGGVPFTYGATITLNGRTAFGDGPSTVLQATNAAQSAIILTGSGSKLQHLKITSPTATTRGSSSVDSAVYINGATGFFVEWVHVDLVEECAIKNVGGANGTIRYNYVTNSLADGIHNTGGANNCNIYGNTVSHPGDDMIAVVSYQSDGVQCHHMNIYDNSCMWNDWGRGITVVGGNNVTISRNAIQRTYGAGIYIASEPAYTTYGVNAVTINDNYIREPATTIHNESILIWGGISTQPVTNVTGTNNDCDPAKTAISFTGTQSGNTVSAGVNTTPNGKNFIGATPQAMSADVESVVSWTVSGTTVVDRIMHYVSDNSAVSGTTLLQGRIYNASNGAVVAYTAPAAIPNGLAGIWAALPFSNPVTLNAGTYYYGVEQGPIDQGANRYYDNVASSELFRSQIFSDTAPASFSGIAGSAFRSMYIVSEGVTGGGGGSGSYVLAGDFLSGTWLKSQSPAGKWDADERSGVGSISVVSSSSVFGGFGKYGRFVMNPGTQTNQGLHNRQLVRMDAPSVYLSGGRTNGVGFDSYCSGGFSFPSGGNTGGHYNGGMIMEIMHNDNATINSQIAPFGLFVHTPNETWNGSSYGSAADQTTDAIVLRVTGGYVPNQQGSNNTSNPQNQSYWHDKIVIPGLQPVVYDKAIWFILHSVLHEYANGSPPGGWNIYGNSPAFNGSDLAGGTLELWCVVTNLGTRPTTSQFSQASPMHAWSPSRGTAIPTLVYGDDGAGNVKHDKPYGPFSGSYDSSPTINYNSEIDWAGCWVSTDFATAVSSLTG